MLTSLVLIVIGVWLTQILVSGLAVFLLMVLFRRGQYGVGRAFVAALGMALCIPAVSLLLTAASYYFWPMGLAGPLLLIVLALVWGRITLPISFGKSAGIGAAWLASMALLSVGAWAFLRFGVCEAFVVPTGAMAPTLNGYNREVACTACGFKFRVNASMEVDPQDGQPMLVRGCTCPNCRKHLHFPASSGDADLFGKDPDSAETPRRDWTSGDRILVAKGLLGPSVSPVRRMEVVVFVYPELHFKQQRRMLYVKRLAGLPEETVALCDGKLHVRSPDKSPRPPEDANAAPDDLWQREFLHAEQVDGGPAALEAAGFVLARKTAAEVLASRRLVHDNDFSPADLKDAPRWSAPQDGTFRRDGVGFTAQPDGDRTSWLRYQHRLRGRTDVKQLISDFEGYNRYEPHFGVDTGENWVSDLMLECEVTADNLSGEVTLELSKGADRFRAVFDRTQVRLVRVEGGEEHELDKAAAPLPAGAHYLRFANVDNRLTVWVGDRAVFGDGVAYPPPRERGPDPQNDLEPASVGVRGAAVTVRHLKLWRDVYYTTGIVSPTYADHERGVDLGNPETWGPLGRRPARTFYVQPGHYFFLGDNSAESSDSRSWGAVPARLLLGKALLVYYPLERARVLH